MIITHEYIYLKLIDDEYCVWLLLSNQLIKYLKNYYKIKNTIYINLQVHFNY